jgi:hypothetical protein
LTLPTRSTLPGGITAADRLGRGLLLAPAIFVAHFVEESRGCVPWFNAHASPDITERSFSAVNLTGLVITLAIVAAYHATRSPGAVLAAVAWLGFLMLANGLFHLIGAVVDRAYVPGLVTAVLLYLPYCAWIAREVSRGGGVRPTSAAVAAVLGGLPMAIHGYLILFRGSRLF